MPIKWDYAQLTHEAALHGGPEGYNAFIRSSGFCEGVLTCIAIKAVHYLFDRYVYTPLCEARLKADQILMEETKAPISEDVKFNRVINDEDDIERVSIIQEETDVDETETASIEDLKRRLDELEYDIPYAGEFEEPMPTRLGFEDELFTYMSEIELCEEDEPLIRIATNHPTYRAFARNYRRHEPEADELQTVKAFVRTMASYAKEDCDEVQS